jgi:glutamyl-tRNA reductase
MTVASPRPASSPSATGAATLVALVAHARSVPSLRREAFADELRRLPEDPGRIVIRTCHRVELFVAAHDGVLADLPDLPAGGERLDNVEAVQHLITVACGLDSAVLGETQILHQLRETLEERHGEQALDPVLDRLFQAALRAGREARGLFTGSPRSLADVALDRIAGPEGHLDGRPVLIVGAGRMGRLAAFAAARRGAEVVVANRTAGRAAALAQEIGGRATPFDIDGDLDPVAGVILAIDGQWPVGPRDLALLSDLGAKVVDLSSPPAVSAEVERLLGDRFVGVDDLVDSEPDAPASRLRTKVERIVSRAGRDYCQWLRTRDAVPAIRAVVGAAEERRLSEIEWLRRRLPDLAAEDLALVEQMSHRLVASILHAPLSALTADERGELEPAARELFGL